MYDGNAGEDGDRVRQSRVNGGKLGACEGVNTPTRQVLTLLSLVSVSRSSSSSSSSSSSLESQPQPDPEHKFISRTLEKKLLLQLSSPLLVVSGSLPPWSLLLPTLTPCIFSHGTRLTLLARSAFGVSRSVFGQQETKVRVAPLRLRMNAIRQRAIGLMDEAFGPGAVDPQALSLQADALYGLEEQLKLEVDKAFKRQRWEEHWLTSAKGTVRRGTLLEDGEVFMASYAGDERARRRRLEIHFVGESGFDAEAGDMAGVTRGFYTDVSREVASVKENEKCRMWIHDAEMSDEKGEEKEERYVIPTPRAGGVGGSELGLFVMPLNQDLSSESFRRILKRFKFLGRLFAAAMRDGFIVPLPLSSAFWSLLQTHTKEKRVSSDEFKDADLPKPGFLGGDVFALLQIVKELKKIDKLEPSERHSARCSLLKNPNFARERLGKKYDLSVNQLLATKTFIDPLSVGEEGCYELLPGGRQKDVTAENLNIYCQLCKEWILRKGVKGQLEAFKTGFNDFVDVNLALNLFMPKEIRETLCGKFEVDGWTEKFIRAMFVLDVNSRESLVAVNMIGGRGGNELSRRFTQGSPTFGFLVTALLEAGEMRRRKFLDFCTSLPVVSKRIELVPIVSSGGEFLVVGEKNLPRANTCSRKLFLPRFEDGEQFQRIFWNIVENESEFKGFHEWTG